MSDYESPLKQYGLSLAAGFLMLSGWGGLFLLVRNVVPTAGPRWLFFMLLYMAIAGTSLPFVRFLNLRFTYEPVPDSVILRESLWCGLYVTTCAWLQIPRVLTWPIALLLALAVIVIEGFLRLREHPHYDE
jgi:hypothetical protein